MPLDDKSPSFGSLPVQLVCCYRARTKPPQHENCNVRRYRRAQLLRLQWRGTNRLRCLRGHGLEALRRVRRLRRKGQRPMRLVRWHREGAVSAHGAVPRPALPLRVLSTMNAATEAQQRAAFEQGWKTFCSQFGPMMTRAEKAGTAEAKWQVINHLDEWTQWFATNFSAHAAALAKTGLPGMQERLNHVQGEIKRFADAYRNAVVNQIVAPPRPAAPPPAPPPAPKPAAPRQTAEDILAAMRKEELERGKRYVEDGYRQREAENRAGTDRIWRDIERQQQAADRMWTKILTRRR